MASVKGALRHLRQGGVVAILCDRDIQKTGQMLPLCGCPARLPTGAAALAVRTGAQIVPAFTLRRGPGRNEVWIEPPLALERTGDEEHDVRAATEKILARLEEYLRQDPGQWTVLEAIWGDDCADARWAVAWCATAGGAAWLLWEGLRLSVENVGDTCSSASAYAADATFASAGLLVAGRASVSPLASPEGRAGLPS
jgi:hypothetical protein